MATTTNLGKVVITPRGAYSPSTAYVALDIIEYNGSGYLVLAPATGVTPPNATYYMLLAEKGVKGDTGQAATVTVGTVGSLPAGSTPTVTNTGTANNAIFNFGLTQGNNWYTGNAITGTSTTPTAYATGITLAGVGDLYLNPSLTADQGNVYRCTTGGNAATARWIYVGNITGTLSGAVAYTAQTPTTGQKTQARANIDAAAAIHASRHGSAGADALSPAIGAIPASEKGSANGVASLDANGKVKAEQMSSNVKTVDAEVYTLSLNDAGMTLLVRNESNPSQENYTINVPKNSDVPFPVGTEIAICRYYSGTVTIQADPSVYMYYPGGSVVESLGVNAQIANRHSMVAIKNLFADRWILTGDFEV